MLQHVPSFESLPDLPCIVTVAKTWLASGGFRAWLSEGSIRAFARWADVRCGPVGGYISNFNFFLTAHPTRVSGSLRLVLAAAALGSLCRWNASDKKSSFSQTGPWNGDQRPIGYFLDWHWAGPITSLIASPSGLSERAVSVSICQNSQSEGEETQGMCRERA